MIIVWGCVEALPDRMEDVKKMSLEHVHRSRKEPGCITHSVQVDIENRNRLLFYKEILFTQRFSRRMGYEYIDKIDYILVSISLNPCDLDYTSIHKITII